MQIHQIGSPVLNRCNKVKNMATVFKGKADFNDDSKIPYEKVDMRAFLNNPIFNMYSRLIQDGYTKEQIEVNDIFCNGFDLSNRPRILSQKPDLKYSKLDDDFLRVAYKYEAQVPRKRTLKTYNDTAAMLSVYGELKKKFVSDDVILNTEERMERYNENNEIYGFPLVSMNELLSEDILKVLTLTNAHSAQVAKVLLNDAKFNNIYLHNAMSNINSTEKSKAAMSVIKFAQEKGYKKDFSYPLAVMVSSACPQNIELIKRLINSEQDFLSRNPDFTENELAYFLMDENPLLKIYLSDAEMDLQTIYDLM